MKKETRNKVISFIIVLILAFIASFIYQNFNILTLNKEKRVESSLDNISYNCFQEKDGELYKTCDDMSITIKDNDIFINKLLLNYETDSNYTWTINYQGKDYYGNYQEKTIDGSNNKDINIFSETIDNTIRELTIKFKSNSSLSISNIRFDNKINLSLSLVFFFEMVSICGYILIVFRKQLKDKYEYIFLVFALCFGSIIILSTPNITNVSWDDQIHFDSVYKVFQGSGIEYTQASLNSIDAVGHSATSFNTSDERDSYYDYLNQNNTEIVKVIDKSTKLITYNDVIYIPSSIAFMICNKLNMPFTISFFLGRLMSLIFYITIVFWAIKKTPKLKKIFTIIGLIPTSLFLATQYNRDSYITSLIMLFMAYFLFEFVNKDKKITKISLFIMIASILFASCGKAIYIPILLLLLLLPKSKFNCKKAHITTKLLIIAIFLLMMSTFVLPAATSEMTADSRGGETNITEQMKLVVSNPIGYARVLYDSGFKTLFNKNIGNETLINYAYSKKQGNNNIYCMFIITLIIVTLYDGSNKIFNKYENVFIFLILFMIWGLIWTALYLSFTPVGYIGINGVQNRYFIPLLAPMLLLFSESNLCNNESKNSLYWLMSVSLFIIYFVSLYENIIVL